MPDARSLRAQADLCIDIASQMSDGGVARKLCADAAKYRAQADKLDLEEQSRAGESE